MKRMDPRLRSTLRDFSRGFAAKREACFQGLDFERLREDLARMKDQAIVRNAELLDRFEARAQRHGSRVLRARDGAEANRLILDVLKEHGVRKIVKGKSMVSEETRLNEFLVRNGVEPMETDLGEWIIQLGAEPPTHMVMPAIHLSRKDVAGIFAGHLGREVADEIPALVRIARDEVRKAVFGAEAGLTGANALIAENGSIMLVTNEGNGRLVTTIPGLHIVFATIEKVVPTTGDALRVLEVLTKNATGQPISSYVSFIAGPHRGRQYIILLDNHRSELAADPVFRGILRCIKCSACLNVCPVYELVGGGEYSYIYMGGIGSLLTAWIHGLEHSKEIAGLCLGCHRCEAVCSAKIPIADLIVRLKTRLNEETGSELWKRIAFNGMMARPGIHRAAFAAGRAARPLISRGKGYARKLPPWMGKYDRFRDLPAPAERPLSRLFKDWTASPAAVPQGTPKGRVIIFPGCLIEHFYPRVGLAASRVLSKLGYEVELGPSACCGFPPANSGFPAAARLAFRGIVEKTGNGGWILTLCPTCTTMLKRAGPELLGTEEASRLAGRTTAFAQFLAANEKEALSRLFKKRRDAGPWTYHDSCHSKHLLGASRDSRDLLRMALDREISEMDSSDVCCGFAGAFSVEHPEISAALTGGKISAVKKTGAGLVATDCPGCLLQIGGGCHRQGLDVAVRHTAEIIGERL